MAKMCRVSPSLNVAYVQLVPTGTHAVVEGALCPALPGGQLAHLGHQRHEVHIPIGTPWSAATQNTLCQLEHLCHQQHEKPSGQIGLIKSPTHVDGTFARQIKKFRSPQQFHKSEIVNCAILGWLFV